MTAPVSLPELQWAAYLEALRVFWNDNGPRPGAILEPVLRIEDLDPRRAQIEHAAAQGAHREIQR